MRLRSSSRCSIRLMPGSSARSVTAFVAFSIASPGSTMVGLRAPIFQLQESRFQRRFRHPLGRDLAAVAACRAVPPQPFPRWRAAERVGCPPSRPAQAILAPSAPDSRCAAD